MIEFRPLTNTSFNQVADVFMAAFSDYEVQLTKNQLQTMLSRRGFVADLSFGAFSDGCLVSFTLNGIGNFYGQKTAYDTGTGTVNEFRGKGLVSEIFAYSLPFLKQAGVTQYLLEVLKNNSTAVAIYKKIGFQKNRSFYYFSESMERINFGSKVLPSEFEIRPLTIIDLEICNDWCDFQPSWQNSFEAIRRRIQDFILLGAFLENRIVGYCVFEPLSGDVTQIAVDQNYRRRGVATGLLRRAIAYNRNHQVKLINTEIGCESIRYFAESLGITLRGEQYEMILDLTKKK